MALGPAKDGWEVDPEGVYTVTGDVSAAAATLFDGWAKEGAMEAAGTFLKGAVTLPGGAFMGIGELSPYALTLHTYSQSAVVGSIAKYVGAGVIGVRACTMEYVNSYGDMSEGAAAHSAMFTSAQSGNFDFFDKYTDG